MGNKTSEVYIIRVTNCGVIKTRTVALSRAQGAGKCRATHDAPLGPATLVHGSGDTYDVPRVPRPVLTALSTTPSRDAKSYFDRIKKSSVTCNHNIVAIAFASYFIHIDYRLITCCLFISR